MTIVTSWLINDRILFATPSSFDFDSQQLQKFIHYIKQTIDVLSLDKSLYLVHDLRKTDDRKQVIFYANSLYPQLIPISFQVLVLSDKYGALEKRLIGHALRDHGQAAVIVYSLNESFEYLQQLDRSLPNLRAAFRARVRKLLNAPLESLVD